MSAATTTAWGPRLLLFGRQGAGKSSLLAALMQTATQPSPVFKGRLADASGKLAGLVQKLAAKQETEEEVTNYPIHFEPQQPGGATWSATVIDCNGTAAEPYLSGKKPLDSNDALGQALLSADTLTLVVEAAGAQLDKDFTQCTAFLRLLREVRGKRVDVAGLPVYLVLTKCDLLAKPTDTQVQWMQRIEEAKRKIGERFKEFLARAGGPTVFGAVDLHLWATADRRPMLGERPARPEPYGVAELFRQCLASAQAFHRGRDQANQRLSMTVAGTSLTIAASLLASLFLVAFQPGSDRVALAEQIGPLVAVATVTGPERLRGAPASLEARLKELDNLRHRPGYDRLPADERDALDRYGRELATYLEVYQDARAKIKAPSLAKNATELAQYEKNLDTFVLPSPYTETWKDSRLDKRVRQVRQEFAALHKAEQDEIDWIAEQTRATRKLRTQGNEFNAQMDAGAIPPSADLDDWFAAVDSQLQFRTHFPRTDPIPEVPGLTYERLDQLPRVQSARADWSSAQAVLRALADELRRRLRKTGAG